MKYENNREKSMNPKSGFWKSDKLLVMSNKKIEMQISNIKNKIRVTTTETMDIYKVIKEYHEKILWPHIW